MNQEAATTGSAGDATAIHLSTREGGTTYTFFMLVKTTPRWLQTSAKDRMAFLRAEVAPLLKRYSNVSMRYYDAEFFTTRCTDVVVWKTQDIPSFQALIEGLRETLFWDSYFEVVEIIPAIEDAYASFPGMETVQSMK